MYNRGIPVTPATWSREAVIHSLTVEERNAPAVPEDPEQKPGYYEGDRANDN